MTSTAATGNEYILLNPIDAWCGAVPAGTIVRHVKTFDGEEPYGVVAVDDPRPEREALFSVQADELDQAVTIGAGELAELRALASAVRSTGYRAAVDLVEAAVSEAATDRREAAVATLRALHA